MPALPCRLAVLMCRLFGMSGAPHALRATFWLLEAQDSLAVQSHQEPDGTGLGVFDADGTPHVDREVAPAYADPTFARDARERCSVTFIAHIRYASTGAVSPINTHPFLQDQRLFAHNGVVGGLDQLDRTLGAAAGLVHGETDSERVFALITQHARDNGGDVTAAIRDATLYIADTLPVYALNLIITTANELWALRYPDTHELWLLERRGGAEQHRHLDAASAAGTIRVRSGDARERPCVVVASERMDDNPHWRLLAPGELVHVSDRLDVQRHQALSDPPRYPLRLADLDSRAARSQLRNVVAA